MAKARKQKTLAQSEMMKGSEDGQVRGRAERRYGGQTRKSVDVSTVPDVTYCSERDASGMECRGRHFATVTARPSVFESCYTTGNGVPRSNSVLSSELHVI